MNSLLFWTNLIRRRSALAAAVLLVGGIASGAAQSAPPAASAAAPATNFDAYRYIGDWNIFNPNRVGRTTTEAAPPPVETISLVGTMRYEKGLFAFFEGTNSANRKAVHVGDTIAEYTVKSITPDAVVLTRDGKETTLAMGQQLRRPPGGDWSVSAVVHFGPEPTVNMAPVIPADASDILKKLMEQRQKQLKQ